MLAFGLLGLGLSVLLATGAWFLVSGYLTAQREGAAAVEARANATALGFGLTQPGVKVPTLLQQLPGSEPSIALVSLGQEWYGTSPSNGATILPDRLVRTVRSNVPATQRISVDGHVSLAVGIPLQGGAVGYYQLFSLDDLNRTFKILSTSLVVAALVTSLIGMAIGRFATRLALRPLAELTEVAAAVARGQLGARLHAQDDPDLGGLARSFNQTAEALQQRVITDVRFAGDVSHELRTPLTTMLNSMQVIQNREAELPPSVREPIDLLAYDLNRFRRLVVDLLEMARHDEGDHSTREPVVIGELIQRAADATAGRPVTRLGPGVERLVIDVDKLRLERVVGNLVANADNHGGGCVSVSVTRTMRGVRMDVDDAGAGVPADRRERIFDRFARGDNRAAAGVGLGLAIVSRHVAWHGGTVTVGDRPGGGARFSVELPTDRRPV
jgi:signal transduction histidine kinase